MEKKAGYRTITYRFRLYCEPMELLTKTKIMYNQVLAFYYDVLRQESGLLETPKLKLMRQMELLTVGTKEECPEDVKYPIPYPKVPLYFRRAAINDAVRLYSSFCSGKEQGTKMAEEFEASPIFYKGMYKEFEAEAIRLKLYNGTGWKWVTCKIDTCGREMPDAEQMMSPVVVLEHGRAMLHVPVKETVADVRTVEERLPNAGKICAITFPWDDTMAVAVVMTVRGEFLASRFIHGGSELKHRRSILLKRMFKNYASMGGNRQKFPPEENKRVREKLYHISDDAAHKVSRELVDFCRQWDVEIIVIPKNKKNQVVNFFDTGEKSGVLSEKNKKISYCNNEKMEWLGRRIAAYIKYKSFGVGIVTTTVTMKGSTTKCHVCGAEFQPDNARNKLSFSCPEGHSGNRYFNTAFNMGKRFLELKNKI